MRERKKWVKEISIEKEWKEKVIDAKQIPKSDDEMKRRIPKGRIKKGRILKGRMLATKKTKVRIC